MTAKSSETARRGAASLAAAAAAILLALLLLCYPPGPLSGFLRAAGAAFLAAATAEGLAAAKDRSSPEGRAAGMLALGGLTAGALLLLAAEAPLQRLNMLLIGAIAIRAVSAGAVAMIVETRGRGWILCRGLGEVAVGIVLVVTMFAVLAALPFASLSTGFTKAQSSVSGDLRYFIAASLILGGGGQLLVALCSPARRP